MIGYCYNKKIKWIDIAKGIAILLVILEHSLFKIDIFGKCILVFHMPFFFFISGFCYNSNIDANKKKNWLKNNIKKYLKIYILFSSIGFIWYLLKNIMSNSISYNNIVTNFFNIFYCNQAKINLVSGGMWFVITLLGCKILFYFFENIAKKVSLLKNVVILLIMFIASIILNYFNINFMPFCLDNIRFAFLFYYLGYIFNNYKIFEKLNNNLYIIVFLLLLIFSQLLNDSSILMHENIYGNYLYFFAGAICGIIFLIKISMYIAESFICNFFIYFGKNTLYFFTMQFIVLDCTKFVIRKINMNSSIQTLFTFIITILILTQVNYLCNKFFTPLLNKNNMSKN